jgi:hypothetical protein
VEKTKQLAFVLNFTASIKNKKYKMFREPMGGVGCVMDII